MLDPYTMIKDFLQWKRDSKKSDRESIDFQNKTAAQIVHRIMDGRGYTKPIFAVHKVLNFAEPTIEEYVKILRKATKLYGGSVLDPIQFKWTKEDQYRMLVMIDGSLVNWDTQAKLIDGINNREYMFRENWEKEHK